MTEAHGNTHEQFQDAMHRSGAVITAQTEQAIELAKTNFEKIATHSRDAIEQSLKTVNVVTGMTRGNVDALLESSRLASSGIQEIAKEIAAYSRNSLDRTASAARAMMVAKTSPELTKIQGEFARREFESAISEVSSLSETMFETMSAIFEPLQKQALAAAQISDLMADV